MRLSDQSYNRLSVLKKLRAAEPVSRTDLARLSGLNGGTITVIVRDLLARGMIVEERISSPKRGRPRLNLRINSEGAYVAGATMTGRGRLIAEIVDLRGSILASHTNAFEPPPRLESLARQFSKVITEAIVASRIPKERVSQIGIGLPAIVDGRAGIVEFFETFEDVPFPFAEAVERDLRIPVRIDNNMNLLARSEHWFGDGPGIDDFTLVLLDLGLGAARYQDGQLVIGSRGIEAEFGHTKITPEGGRPCHCGARGCLQAYCSKSAIVYQATERAGEDRPPIYELSRKFRELLERAKVGDAAVAELFNRAGRYLGRALANHINMQDPERIIVLTRSPALVELISDPFFEALHRDTLPALRDRGKIIFKELHESAHTRGAAALVLEQLYQAR